MFSSVNKQAKCRKEDKSRAKFLIDGCIAHKRLLVVHPRALNCLTTPNDIAEYIINCTVTTNIFRIVYIPCGNFVLIISIFTHLLG